MQNEIPFEFQPDAEAELPATEALHGQHAEREEEIPPFDPVRCIAMRMLSAAMGKPGQSFAVGLHIVVAPNDDWRPAIVDIAHDVHFGGRPGERRPRMVGSGRPALQALELSPKAEARQVADTISNVEQALSENKAVVLITGSAACVPRALQAAADQILVAPPPCQEWLAALVREAGLAAEQLEFADLAFDRLTPASIRLAFRPRVDGSSFVRRLRDLTELSARPGKRKVKQFDQIHGVDEVKAWAEAVQADVALYRRGELRWDELPRGLLLVGPPGTAKTTCAAAVADFCGLDFIGTSYAAWQRHGTGHLGHVLQAMAASFDEARTRKPCVLFIDEMDSLGSRGGHDGKYNEEWWRNIINAMLDQLDGRYDNEGVMFIGATNYPELIDPALLRSGRMEDRIALHPPGPVALAAIYRDELAQDSDPMVDYEKVGRMSAGMTGADVVRICKAVRRRARNVGRAVTAADLLAVISGQDPTEAQQMRIALHEAGHAVAAVFSPALRLDHVSVVGWDSRGGGAAIAIRRDKARTTAALTSHLAAVLAGRAAEEVLLGAVSAGAGGPEHSDLALATQLAAEADLAFGLRSNGLIWYAPPPREKLTGLLSRRPDLASSVQDRLDHAYAEALALIKTHAPLVRRLAERLMAEKVLTGEEVAAIVHGGGRTDPPPTEMVRYTIH